MIQAIIELAEHAAKEPWTLAETAPEAAALQSRIDELARASMPEAYKEREKAAR